MCIYIYIWIDIDIDIDVDIDKHTHTHTLYIWMYVYACKHMCTYTHHKSHQAIENLLKYTNLANELGQNLRCYPEDLRIVDSRFPITPLEWDRNNFWVIHWILVQIVPSGKLT